MSEAALDSGALGRDKAFYIANAVISIAAVGLLTWILMLRNPEADAGAWSFLPAVNASLNSLAASFLVAGWFAIQRRKLTLHRNLMLSALAASGLFLVSYLAYHYMHGDTRYPGAGAIRVIYLSILASHVILSIIVFPMILATFWFALTKRLSIHKRLAKWTLPIWLYVSVTGVVVFLMLRAAMNA